MPDDGRILELGRIVGVYGVHGWLRVESWTRPVANLLQYRDWQLSGVTPGRVQVAEGRLHGRGIVVALADTEGNPLVDRDEAVTFVGTTIGVDRSALPELPDGSYYWADLIGFRVENLQSEILGRVDSVASNGAQDIMTVTDGSRQQLIPFVAGPIVHRVNVDDAVILVDWGLDY